MKRKMQIMNIAYSPALLWFIAGLVLVLLEFGAPGLILFFFAAGAWVVSLICLFADISLNVQLSVFLIVSILLLILLRKRLSSIFMGSLIKRGAANPEMEEYVGQRAVVTSKIEPNLPGKVEFRGSLWNAESDEIIDECTPVEIV